MAKDRTISWRSMRSYPAALKRSYKSTLCVFRMVCTSTLFRSAPDSRKARTGPSVESGGSGRVGHTGGVRGKLKRLPFSDPTLDVVQTLFATHLVESRMASEDRARSRCRCRPGWTLMRRLVSRLRYRRSRCGFVAAQPSRFLLRSEVPHSSILIPGLRRAGLVIPQNSAHDRLAWPKHGCYLLSFRSQSMTSRGSGSSLPWGGGPSEGRAGC